MKKETETKMVNYICPVFRIATQTFKGAIWWGTFGTLFKSENVVVSLWKILSKCHKEIICPEQFNPARRFAERLNWRLLSLFCSVRTLSAPVEKFSTVHVEYARLEKLLVQLAALARGRLPMLYKFTFIYVLPNKMVPNDLSPMLGWDNNDNGEVSFQLRSYKTSLKNDSNKYQSKFKYLSATSVNITYLV